MQCEEFKDILMELVDGELGAERVRDAEAHAAECRSCGSQLAAAREEARLASDVMRQAFKDVRPDPVRRREFIERLGSPRPKILRFAWVAAAAAALFAVLWITRDQPPDPASFDPLAAVRQEIEQRLGRLNSAQGEAIEDVLALEQAAIEESISQPVDISFDAAPRELTSKDMSRRVGARKTLARATREQIIRIRVDDPAASRYVRALARSTQEGEPKPEGQPMITIKQTVNDRTIDFMQYPNGVIHLKAAEPGLTADVWAFDMYDLMAKQPELCKRLGIVGGDGSIKLGSSIQSTTTVFRGVSRVVMKLGTEQSMAELERIRMETLKAELTRRKGDAAVAQQIAAAIEKALKEQSKATKDAVDRARERVRQLELFCEQVRQIK